MREDGAALDLRAYERAGGYAALRDALRRLAPAEVQKRVKDSGLRGRGGAGFPTGQKWSFVPMGADAPHPKYLVVNADEMEPGTFKDRLLMERDPHQLVEGVILSAYAIEADVAYIFLRWAYKLSEARLARAIAEAYDAGYLGRQILGSGYSLELRLHISGGRYMAGEETGLINALEGRRANPRSKPPYPAVVGLWGRPTVVNNVETICNVPHVIGRGAEAYRKLSATGEGGTKLYGASGRVKRPGLWELPLGTTIREILEEHAGGMRDGVRFRGLLPGGASTDFLVDEHLDAPMDFESLQKHGSRMGTGTMIVLDDRTCPVGMIRNLEEFFAQESCGWCTPCWAGLHWVADILRDFEEGRGEMADLDTLAAHARLLAPGNTYCALAPGAAEPLQSGLRHFRDDFERHVREHRCPWR
ncbi:MAG: NADH-quinone oxidoreductase subunit NuoF [Acidobacteria bacterium]|nr:NADH-quinone oxidoreductase subunit NuoF [Acidobacteriota bacterium]